MKLSKLTLLGVLLAAAPPAVADDDPGMALMTVMMRCPAMSADGKHVAFYGNDPGSAPDARTSLAVVAPSGALEQRISVVPPAVDPTRAKAAAATVTKLLDDGKYKRMGRVARASETATKTTYATKLTTGDVAVDISLANRKLSIRGARGGKAIPAITRELGAGDGPCAAVDSYSIANAMAGYDATTHVFAFSVAAVHGDQVCFQHDFVVAL